MRTTFLAPAIADALAPSCEFDLHAPRNSWCGAILWVLSERLRRLGMEARFADIGLCMRLVEPPEKGNGGSRASIAMTGTGHRRHALPATYHLAKGGHDAGLDRFVEDLVERHHQCERVAAEGGDPTAPTAARVVTHPSLVAAIAASGVDPEEVARIVPACGQTVVGRGWRRGVPPPRTVEIGSLRAHVSGRAGRLVVLRVALGEQAHYDPPTEPGATTGTLTVRRVTLAETMRGALVGGPARRLVDHPVVGRDAVITGVRRSGAGIVATLRDERGEIRLGG